MNPYALIAFGLGAVLITGFVYGAIYMHRKKHGDDRLLPPAVWASWVTLAIYGVGAREDYRLDEAVLYPCAAFVIWALMSGARAVARPRA